MNGKRVGKETVLSYPPRKVWEDLANFLYRLPPCTFVDDVDIRHFILSRNKKPKLILTEEVLKRREMVLKHLKDNAIPWVFVRGVEFPPVVKKPVALDLNNSSVIVLEPNTRKKHLGDS